MLTTSLQFFHEVPKLRSMRPASFLICVAVLVLTISTALGRNVLLVIADDLGTDGLAAFNTNANASVPATPTIDALVRRGVRFVNAYGYPVCSPTRSAILTGRYGFRTGVAQVVGGAGAPGVYTNEVTLPEILATTHQCGSVGKWHLGSSASAPNLAGGWPYFSGSLSAGLGANATGFYTWTKVSNGTVTMNYSAYATSDNVNDALAWLAGQGTNSWFLWLAFNAPHSPYHRPPTNLCPDYADLSGAASDIQRNPRRYYEAAVQAMDTELGRLLRAIDTNKTTIFFIGDNGTPGNLIQPPFTAARGKDTLYEGGVRVPFVAAGPGIVNPGRTSDAVVHIVDLFATILDVSESEAKVTAGAVPRDSRSLNAILRDEPFRPDDEAILVENADPISAANQPGRAVRRGEHKLIQFANQAEEFYHLATDPLERTNLLRQALEPVHEANLAALRAKLNEWRNVPTLQNPIRAGQGFTVEAAWFANHNLSLWRTGEIAGTAWSRVPNATEQVVGSLIRLADPDSASPNRAYYRVGHE